VEYLCIFSVALLSITLIGHAIWVVCAAVIRALFGVMPTGHRGGRAEECARCGRLMPAWRDACEWCHLARNTILAHELADLAASQRQLKRLFTTGAITGEVFQLLSEAVKRRHDELLGKPTATPRPAVAAATPPVVEEEPILTVLPADSVSFELPAVQLLANLLASCRSVSDLARVDRDRALGWYRASSEGDLAALPLGVQRSLARLLKLSSLVPEALRAFNRGLQAHPADALVADMALEAGRFAIQAEERAAAVDFLTRSRDSVASAEIRAEAEKLLQRLQPSAETQASDAIAHEATPVQPAMWVTPEIAPSTSAPAADNVPPAILSAASTAPPSEPILEAIPMAEAPRRPRRSMLELLSAFMEQSNILWGELIGGLLIVVFSIALVISLWPKLEENPAYQFMIFVSVTTMLFGAGLYAFHHWKLESTSRGLLVIATLLVPLNFLAIAAQMKGVSGPLELTLELVSLGVFAALLHFTGRVLVPDGRFWFPIAVLGTSASQLLMPKVVGEGGASSAMPLLLLGVLPIGCHLLGCFGATRRAVRAGTMNTSRAAELFVLLGTSTFAIGAALGLLVSWNVFQGGDVWLTLARLAIGMTLAALPLLTGGVLVHRLIIDETTEGEAASSPVGGLRTGATATALVGMFAMLLSVVLAWPISSAVLLVCALNFGVLTYLAWRQEMPFAHAAALPCLAVGYLTAFNLLIGGEIAGALLTAENGVALAGLVLVLAAVSEVLFRKQKPVHAQFYGIGAGVLAIASLLLVTLPDRGIEAPGRAMVLYALYGLGTLIVNARWRRPMLTSVGLAVLAAASLWGLWWQDLDREVQRVPLWSAVLAAEAFGLVVLSVFTRRVNSTLWQETYREPAMRTAEGMAPLALLAAFWSGIAAFSWFGEYVVTGGCLSAVFLMLAGLERRPALARVGGVVLIGTAIATCGWIADLRESTLLQKLSLVAFGLATTAAAMAVAATAAMRRSETDTEAAWYAPFAALRDTACVAVVLAALLAPGTLSLGQSPLTTGTGLLLAGTVFLLAWGYDVVALSWIASFLLLGTVTYEFARRFALPTPWPTLALLTHATLGIAAATTLRFLRWVDGETKLARLFERPLSHTAFVTSAISLGVVFHVEWATLQTCSLCLLWLAGLWLVQAWSEVRPGLFAAFQAVLAIAIVGLTADALQHQEWFIEHPWGSLVRVFDPWSLQAFSLALGTMSLAWVGTRIVLRSQPRAQRLLEPGWRTTDRVILASLVIGQLVIGALFLMPFVWREIEPLARSADREGIFAHAFGAGAWSVLGLLGGVLVLGLWERRAAACILGLATLALTVPVLIAGPFDAVNAAGLALRWAMAFGFLAAGVPVLLRDRLWDLAVRAKCKVEPNESLSSFVRAILVGGMTVPILAMTLSLALAVIAGQHPLSPDEGTFFFSLGRTMANVVPLAVIAFTLVAYALRERSAGYAFKAGLVVNFTVVIGHAIGFITHHTGLDFAAAVQLQIQLMQLASITASAWALAWIGVRWKWCDGTPAPWLLPVQLGLGVLAGGLVLGIAIGDLIVSLPPHVPGWTVESGSALGWIVLLTAAMAGACFAWEQRKRPALLATGLIGLAFAAQLACTVGAHYPEWGYRTLMLGCGAYALAAAALGFQSSRRTLDETWAKAFTTWVSVAGTVAVLLALKAAIVHKDHGWAAAVTLAVSLATGLLAVQTRVPWQVFASGLLLNATGFIAWLAWGEGDFERFILAQALCFGAGSGFWAALARRLHNPGDDASFRLTWPALVQPYTHLSSLCGLFALSGLTLAGVAWSLTAYREAVGGALPWWTLLAVSVPFVSRRRDENSWFAFEGMYALGLTAIGIALNQAHLRVVDYLWSTSISLAPYMAFAAGLVWAVLRYPGLRVRLLRKWDSRLPEDIGPSRPWFITAETIVAVLAGALSVWISLYADFSTSARLAGPFAVALLGVGYIFLAEGVRLRQTESSSRFALDPAALLRYAALGLGALMAAETGWATLDAGEHTLSWLVLHRTVLLMVALALTTVVYGMVLAKRLPSPGWAESCRRAGPVLGIGALAVLAVIIAQEAWLYTGNDKAPPMALPAVIVVTLALVGLIAAGLAFAVAPGRDPLGLSERGRTAYVYGAEVLLVLIFVHLRLTEPGIFRRALMAHYWPFVLMGIAFLGAFLSEIFERRNLRVLAEPLERTGVFLPVLPMLAAWTVPTVNYSFIWFSSGLLYGLLSVRKRSFRFALLAALAANAGVWVLLQQGGIDFFRHPQFWLIPLAMIVLVSEFYNRDRLTEVQSATLRYLGLIVIYVSSTADMFIEGVGNSALYPVILALLSVLGILSGMVLRIRAFLLLGLSFLMLVLLSIIWHAGVDRGQTWILWSAGIALGIAILTLFGIFEKRRNDVLAVIDNLKRWK
jgi:hypothetical protein